MAPASPSFDAAVVRIGRELHTRSSGLAPRLFDRRWWSNTLLEWSMKDEAFKVQLFRFIDVLPSLKDDAQVARLAEEYLGDSAALTAAARWGLRAMSATKLGARLSGASLRRQVAQMAKIFIAGESVQAALPVLGNLWRDHRAFSVDLLGEATVSEAEGDQYRDRCLDALRLLGKASADWPASPLLERDHLGPLPRVHLSVKLSALYSQLDGIDPDGSYHAIAARLRPILDLAAGLPAGITFDMEQAEFKDLYLTIFMRLLSEPDYRRYPYAGIALQAYLTETQQDLGRLLQWVRQRGVPVGIRLVKGAYWDSETIRYQQRGWPVPVYGSKAETDESYERLSLTLIEHADLIRPAFGTHNLRSLAHAEAAAQAAGLPAEACEYQMIFGMAEPLQAAVAHSARRVRIYTPVGDLLPGMAYLVRRLLENTSNESFLRKEYSDAEPLEHLLAPPSPAPRPHEPADGARAAMDRFVNEPQTDFSKAPAREAMSRALAHVRQQLGRDLPYDGRPEKTHPELASRNPSAPDEIVGRMRACGPDEIEAALRIAVRRFPDWRDTPAARRVQMLRKAAALMRERRFELAAWEVLETGKPWREADADVAEAIDFLEFYAQGMQRLGRPRRLGHEPGELNHLLWSPRGVAAVISPWNFPLAIPTGMVAAALVTGNVVLFKPSERAPAMAWHLTTILHEAGIPGGVLHLLPGGPEIGRSLVLHPDVHLVAFTGSQAVGLWMLEQAGRTPPGRSTIKRVIAEMGGKNAIVIDETADLDEAVAGVIASFTGYQGQKCSACSRAIVLGSVHDLLLPRLKEAVLSLRIGPPEEPAHRMGPMIDARAREKVREYVAIGKQEGRLIVEREREGPGYFAGPAVFAGIEPQHRLAQEEIFGPVLAVMRARDFDDALRLANASSYALTGGLYSRSPAHIALARHRFDVGNLYLNRPITGALVNRQPFGGHRLSGVGAKAGGDDYLQQFMVARVVSENTLRRGFAPTDTE